MSIEAELRAEVDSWERWRSTGLKVLPYVLLAVSVVVTLLDLRQVPVHLPEVLALSAAAALWLLWFHTLHPGWHGNGPLMGLYYTGLMAMAACLVALAPWYGIFCSIGFPHALHYLNGRWRYVGTAATAMTSAGAYLGGASNIVADHMWWAWLVIGVIATTVAVACSYFAEMADRRNEKQKRALVELHEANVRLEAALAENAGLHAQLLVQAREAGVSDERQRMAREIHDTLAQNLAGILTQLQAAEHTVDEPRTLRWRMTNATNLAREGLTEARRTVHAVEPAVLAEARLPDAIGEVARQWSETNHVDAALTTTGDARPMHTDIELALLRTAQEALTNVARHARASRVGITLSYMDDLVTLDVRDDGVGFEADAKPAVGVTNGGFGIAGMRQRVQRLAGRLEIESEPGSGTAISATVPALPAGGVQ